MTCAATPKVSAAVGHETIGVEVYLAPIDGLMTMLDATVLLGSGTGAR